MASTAATVLVTLTSQAAAEHAAPRVSTLTPDAGELTGGRVVEIPVVYDGEDLDSTAALLGISRERLVQTHCSTTWTAAFGGFAPADDARFTVYVVIHAPKVDGGGGSITGPVFSRIMGYALSRYRVPPTGGKASRLPVEW